MDEQQKFNITGYKNQQFSDVHYLIKFSESILITFSILMSFSLKNIRKQNKINNIGFYRNNASIFLNKFKKNCSTINFFDNL